MKTFGTLTRALVIVSLTLSAPALAHHSYAMFDRNKTVTISGTIKEFQWANPHIYMYVDVADAKGAAVTWAVEGNGPALLERKGWTKHTISVGDKVTVDINPVKDGRTGGYLVKVMLANGTALNAGGNQVPAAPPADQK